MEENSNSVYYLITKLCEKVSNNSKKPVKALRAQCYEILLSKIDLKGPEPILENNKDPICNLLAWKYELLVVHNRPQLAEKLQKCIDKLEKYKGPESDIISCVLHLLIQFRKVPPVDCSIMEKLMGTASFYQQINTKSLSFLKENTFKLPTNLTPLCQGINLSDESFYLNPRERKVKPKFSANDFRKNSFCTLYWTNSERSISHISCRSSETDENMNQKGFTIRFSEDLATSDDFWEEVSKIEITPRRTWESYGDSFPAKELPFVTEFGDKMDMWALQPVRKDPFQRYTFVTREGFINDIKYLLIGITSNTFISDEKGILRLKPGVYFKSVTPEALETYSSDFLYCGNCYRALNDFVSIDEVNGKYKYEGYIFTEVCESIKRHLIAYRTVALSLPIQKNLLAIRDHIRNLYKNIDVLAGICKVGPYADERGIPLGGALLSYLCKSAMNCTNNDTLMVLCSMLFPCCQVYFNRFLQLWILEGILKDPYNEFFIKPNLKYTSVKSRSYWTKSYIVNNNLVPEFLQEIKQNILACGKSMQLLKLCVPSSPLCVRTALKKAAFMSCCITAEQLKLLEQNVNAYYLETSIECSPAFSLSSKVRRMKEYGADFRQIAAKKRLATLRRLELERMRWKEIESEKKREEMRVLKEQYDLALLKKNHNRISELRDLIRYEEKELELETIRERLIEEEAKSLITYYENLSKICDVRTERIKKRTQDLKVQLEDATNPKTPPKETECFTTGTEEGSSSSPDSFSTPQGSPGDSPRQCTPPEPTNRETTEDDTPETSPSETHTSVSLDIINANATEKPQLSDAFLAAQENFRAARRNRAKVMSLELGLDGRQSPTKKALKHVGYDSALTEAQRNKLKVMSSEFGINVVRDTFAGKAVKSDMMVNRLKNLSSNDCFLLNKHLDNANYTNRNIEAVGDTVVTNNNPCDTLTNENSELLPIIKLPSNATIENQATDVTPIPILKLPSDPTIENQPTEVTPMSVDSTPISDLPSTPSTFQIQQMIQQTGLDTAATNFSENGFNFETNQAVDTISGSIPMKFSKRVAFHEAEKVSINCLQLFMQQSVEMPLFAQIELTNRELLKYFAEELNYLEHLECLRDFFFLQDGEFGRNLTEGLFERLYEAEDPADLMNLRTLQILVQRALCSSTKTPNNSERLSFKINSLPSRFNLSELEALDCLSLTYAVEWPLSLLLPSDTLSKYDAVFKYLLKLHRVLWVQKRIFEDMKTLVKQVGKHQMYLLSSPQFTKIHRFRHQMTHFIQTFQNYIIGEVLHSNWITFEENLMDIKNIDQLYGAHIDYLKNILFMCLLKQEAQQVRLIFEKIFVVFLKFYDYLRSQTWTIKDGLYVHPNFIKLENIFFNFEEFVLYLFKVGQKIIKTGYQPHLVQLLDMLDVNGYYTSRMHYLK